MSPQSSTVEEIWFVAAQHEISGFNIMQSQPLRTWSCDRCSVYDFNNAFRLRNRVDLLRVRFLNLLASIFRQKHSMKHLISFQLKTFTETWMILCFFFSLTFFSATNNIKLLVFKLTLTPKNVRREKERQARVVMSEKKIEEENFIKHRKLLYVY